MSFSASTYGAGYSKTKSVATGLKSTSQNADGTIKVTYMDGKSYTTPNIKGADGKDGKDGHTPTVEEITPIVEGVFDAHKSEFVGSEYPDYAKTEMLEVADKLNGFISTIDNPIIIGFNTDQHVVADLDTDSYKKLTNEIKYGLLTLRDLTKKIPFNFCVLGGDTIGKGDTVSAMQFDTRFVIEQLDGCGCPYVCLVGNHDGGQNNQSITLAQVAKSHITPSVANKVVTADNNANYYYDDTFVKVRYVCLNSFYRSGTWKTDNMKAFLNNALGNLPTDYKAVIFSHHPINSKLGWNNAVALEDALTPYAEKIICCVNGHTHNNLSATIDGILYISTTTAGRYELNDGSTRPYDSAEATAYDVLVIDTDSKKVHCIRYGNGADRDFNIPTPTPTPTYDNKIPTSIDSDGTVYNEVGYKLQTRLNSSGVPTSYTSAECGCTGFIAIENGDVIRTKNCKMLATDTGHIYIAVYDENFTMLHSKAIASNTAISDKVIDENGYVTQFTINKSGAKYMRVSSDGINALGVITVNEEIG